MKPDSTHNVTSLLKEVADRIPDKAALVFKAHGAEKSITFGTLWNQIDLIATGLKAAGFLPGQRSIVMIPMSIDLYVTMLAVIKLGGAAVFVDPWIGGKQIARFAAFAEPTAFIGIGKSHILRLFDKRLRGIEITVTNGTKLLGVPAKYDLNDLRKLAANDSAYQNSDQQFQQTPIQPVDANDSALITFTSGSSGEPKGANRTHRFLAAQHRALKHEFPYRADDVDMPMFPVFALNNLVTGLTSIVPEMDFRHVNEVDGNAIAGQMSEHGVTTVTASPPLIDRVAPFLKKQSNPIHIRRILTGGAPVTDEQLVNWTESYPETELVVAYGSTEAEPVGHITAQQRLELSSIGKGFCTGQPTNLVETRILPITKGAIEINASSIDQLALPSQQVGELVVSGEHVCRDYFRNEGATKENKLVDQDGKLWHRMGDTGYFDEQGRFWLVGRVHSSIRRGNQWLHPQLIEQIARNADQGIQQVAAIGVPGESIEEEAILIVVFKESDLPDNSEARSEICEKIRTELNAHKQICDAILLTKERLPLDPRHRSKIDYAETKKRFENGVYSAQDDRKIPAANSPFVSRFKAYLDERFPLFGHGLLIVSYYSSNQFLAEVLTNPGEKLLYSLGSLLGAITLLCLFFHLRVFDEHKDYLDDVKHYPHRILSRGLITLKHLKLLGAVAITLELVLAAVWMPMGKPAALVAVLLTLGFSLLMLKEFFIPKWLKQHFLVYAISHMMIMPLMALMVFSFATGLYPWQAPAWFYVYAFVGFFVTLNWEISRKIRAPEQEIEGVDSYTKIFGTYGAAYAVLIVRVIDTAIVALVGWHIGASMWFYAALVLLFMVCLVGFFQYRFNTSPKTAKRMEVYAGMYIIAFDLILAIELICRRGVEFTWLGT